MLLDNEKAEQARQTRAFQSYMTMDAMQASFGGQPIYSLAQHQAHVPIHCQCLLFLWFLQHPQSWA